MGKLIQLKCRPVLVSRARPIYAPAAYRCSDYKLNIDCWTNLFAVLKGCHLLAQLLCHTSTLLTSACEEAMIM